MGKVNGFKSSFDGDSIWFNSLPIQHDASHCIRSNMFGCPLREQVSEISKGLVRVHLVAPKSLAAIIIIAEFLEQRWLTRCDCRSESEKRTKNRPWKYLVVYENDSVGISCLYGDRRGMTLQSGYSFFFFYLANRV